MNSDPSAPRAPPDEQTLRTYMESREIISTKFRSVVVDGFRFTTPYLKWKESLACADAPAETSTGGRSAFQALFFLSHYHSDHYAGIHPNWQPDATIYASHATAKLLERHGLAPQRLVGLEMEKRYLFSLQHCKMIDVEGADDGWAFWQQHRTSLEGEESGYFTVTLIDANHCPGAAMLLFESCVTRAQGGFGSILHTGDFRYNGDAYVHPRTASVKGKRGSPQKRPRTPRTCQDHRVLGSISMCDSLSLQRAAGKVNTLFLDNTFCDPSFKFPPQELVFETAIRAVRITIKEQVERVKQQQRVLICSEEGVQPSATCTHASCQSTSDNNSNPKSCVHIAVLIGTYTIGKERVAMAIHSSLYNSRSGGNSPSSADSLSRNLLIDEDDEGTASKANVPPIYVSASKAELLAACNLMDLGTTVFEEIGPRNSPTASQESGGLGECATVPPQVQLPSPTRPRPPKPFVESPVDRTLFSQSDDAAFENEADSNSNIRCFVTMYLVPMNAMSYPCLANSVMIPPSEPTKTENGGPEGLPSTSGRHLMLWGGYYLPVTMFDRIVCIEPTGWTFRQSKKEIPPTSLSTPVPKKVANKYDVYSLPYSEHSSFDELLDFVSFVQPEKIVPTVSLEQFRKQEPLFVESCPRLRSKYANVQPLSRFFDTNSKKSQAPFQLANTKSEVAVVNDTNCNLTAKEEPVVVAKAVSGQVTHPHRDVRQASSVSGPSLKNNSETQDKKILLTLSDDDDDDEVKIVAVSHKVFEIDDDE